MAQALFKSKSKSDKSNHIANYVSNIWVKDSLMQLQSSESVNSEEENMHVVLIKSGLQVMTDSFVIDSEKKLNVLKEKQGIHWQGTATMILTYGMKNKVNELSHAAGLAKRHFANFKKSKTLDSKSSEASSDQTASVVPKRTDSISLEEMAKKKRDERMKLSLIHISEPTRPC